LDGSEDDILWEENVEDKDDNNSVESTDNVSVYYSSDSPSSDSRFVE
jgi:hypothetical protein